VICRSAWVWILSHLWWGRMHLLLGVHHPLVWNGVLQHDWGWLLHILLWGLLRGRRCWGTWSISDSFIHLKSSDLREMVSIMAILTAKGTREVCLKIVVILPLVFVVISPLGVLVPLILVSPDRLVLLGVIPSWSWIIIVSVFSFLFGIIRLMGRIFHIQLFKILILLNGRGLNKVNPSVWVSLWWSHGLWRARKWKVWIILWQ
jgi:hypothetical protein